MVKYSGYGNENEIAEEKYGITGEHRMQTSADLQDCGAGAMLLLLLLPITGPAQLIIYLTVYHRRPAAAVKN